MADPIIEGDGKKNVACSSNMNETLQNGKEDEIVLLCNYIHFT